MAGKNTARLGKNDVIKILKEAARPVLFRFERKVVVNREKTKQKEIVKKPESKAQTKEQRNENDGKINQTRDNSQGEKEIVANIDDPKSKVAEILDDDSSAHTPRFKGQRGSPLPLEGGLDTALDLARCLYESTTLTNINSLGDTLPSIAENILRLLLHQFADKSGRLPKLHTVRLLCWGIESTLIRHDEHVSLFAKLAYRIIKICRIFTDRDKSLEWKLLLKGTWNGGDANLTQLIDSRIRYVEASSDLDSLVVFSQLLHKMCRMSRPLCREMLKANFVSLSVEKLDSEICHSGIFKRIQMVAQKNANSFDLKKIEAKSEKNENLSYEQQCMADRRRLSSISLFYAEFIGIIANVFNNIHDLGSNASTELLNELDNHSFVSVIFSASKIFRDTLRIASNGAWARGAFGFCGHRITSIVLRNLHEAESACCRLLFTGATVSKEIRGSFRDRKFCLIIMAELFSLASYGGPNSQRSSAAALASAESIEIRNSGLTKKTSPTMEAILGLCKILSYITEDSRRLAPLQTSEGARSFCDVAHAVLGRMLLSLPPLKRKPQMTSEMEDKSWSLDVRTNASVMYIEIVSILCRLQGKILAGIDITKVFASPASSNSHADKHEMALQIWRGAPPIPRGTSIATLTPMVERLSRLVRLFELLLQACNSRDPKVQVVNMLKKGRKLSVAAIKSGGVVGQEVGVGWKSMRGVWQQSQSDRKLVHIIESANESRVGSLQSAEDEVDIDSDIDSDVCSSDDADEKDSSNEEAKSSEDYSEGLVQMLLSLSKIFYHLSSSNPALSIFMVQKHVPETILSLLDSPSVPPPSSLACSLAGILFNICRQNGPRECWLGLGRYALSEEDPTLKEKKEYFVKQKALQKGFVKLGRILSRHAIPRKLTSVYKSFMLAFRPSTTSLLLACMRYASYACRTAPVFLSPLMSTLRSTVPLLLKIFGTKSGWGLAKATIVSHTARETNMVEFRSLQSEAIDLLGALRIVEPEVLQEQSHKVFLSGTISIYHKLSPDMGENQAAGVEEGVLRPGMMSEKTLEVLRLQRLEEKEENSQRASQLLVASQHRTREIEVHAESELKGIVHNYRDKEKAVYGAGHLKNHKEDVVRSHVTVDYKSMNLSHSNKSTHIPIPRLRDMNMRLAVGPIRDDLTKDEKKVYQSVRDQIAKSEAEYSDKRTGSGFNVVKWTNAQYEAEIFDRAFDTWGDGQVNGIAEFERANMQRENRLRKKFAGGKDRNLHIHDAVLLPFGDTFITVREGDEDPYISLIRTDTKVITDQQEIFNDMFLPKTTSADTSNPKSFFDRVRKDQLDKRASNSRLRSTMRDMQKDLSTEVDVLARKSVMRSYAEKIVKSGLI